MDLPRISVVTCSWNQGRYIGRTIDSVLSQNYPNLEHIIVDNMSTDETPQVLARYPHLHVIREPDGGQAEAINKGFRAATGDILCFLNSDDTFLPGALHRVAREIDPANDKHVVVGRCLFTDEDGTPTGLEQPAAFTSHERVLAVWRGHNIPQPATFWTREVWDRCGPLDEKEQLVLDYDLMCRFSKHYDFTCVDQVLATWRLHDSSKSCTNTSSEIFQQALRASKRYWGPVWKPKYWRLWVSLLEHTLEQKTQRRKIAGAQAIKAYHARAVGRFGRCIARMTLSALLAPDVALKRFRKNCELVIDRLTDRHMYRDPWRERRHRSPRTLSWRSFTGLHRDNCVGPRFVTPLDVQPGQTTLHLEAVPVIPRIGLPMVLEFAIDGQIVACHRFPPRRFTLDIPLPKLSNGEHELTITTTPFVVLDDYVGNNDYRPLAFRLKRLALSDGRLGDEMSPTVPFVRPERVAA